jgi:fumarate hydratase class II
VAVGLYKIATDIRWMGSGPRAGLAEIHVPDLQPGSSIMPGKVNPVVAESLSMVCAQVIGNDAAIAFGGAAGNFELNLMLPVLARNVLESISLLAAGARNFADRCVRGITADENRTREYAEGSPSVATALNPVLGYEESASVAKQALAEHKTIRQVVIERGHVERGTITADDLDRLLDVEALTRPNGDATT